MHFSYALNVILFCLIVACNGQFKIIGLLDTKSENNNGKVETIRSFDEVGEQFPRPQNKDLDESHDLTETINVSESADVTKENVNFIKPYEVVTNEWKIDSVEATSESTLVKNITGNVLELEETEPSKNLPEKSVNSETISDSDVEAAGTLSTTTSSTTIGAKAYRSECMNLSDCSSIEQILQISELTRNHFLLFKLTNMHLFRRTV